jgi:hypothetical protein
VSFTTRFITFLVGCTVSSDMRSDCEWVFAGEYKKLQKVIEKMEWPEFRDHWVSQKWRYDSFFQKTNGTGIVEKMLRRESSRTR